MKARSNPFFRNSLIVALLALGASAHAATYTYSGTASATDNWAAGTNWDATPVRGIDTILNYTSTLDAGVVIVSNNDVATPPFQLNQLSFTNVGPASGTAPTVTLQGSQLECITNSGAIAPSLLFNTTGTVKPTITINNNLLLTNNLAVTATTDGTLGGTISGSGSLTKTGAGTLRLNGANTMGDVAVNVGTLFTENSMTFGNLSVASAKTFQFGAQNAAYTINTNGLSGAGTVTTANSGGFQRNLTLGNSDATADFSGVITQSGNRALVLTKLGIGTQTLSGSVANTQGGGTGVGFDTYIQAGTMILNKTAAVALPGDVFLTGGTLQLSGTGDNQIADTAAVSWSSGAFDLNGSSETIGALTVSVLSASANQINVAANKTFTATGNVNIFNSAATTLGTSVTFNSAASTANSTFAITGASSFIFGQDSTTGSTTRTNTLDMRNLAVFNAGTSGTALTNFVVGNYVQATATNYNDGGINTAYLAPTSTLYSTAFSVGKKVGTNAGQFNNTLYLGSGTTAIHATTITVGETGSVGTGSTIKWNTGVTAGSLTLNGTGVTAAVTNMYVGYKTDTASASAGTRLGTADLSNGTVTGNITNLYVGYKTTNDSGTAPATTTGVFKLGAGAAGALSNLTIGNLTLAQSTSNVTSRNNPVNGTFQLDGGTVGVTNNVVLTNESLYDQRNGTLTINGGLLTIGGNITTGITRATSLITLSGGTLDMTGGDIGTSASPIGTFNYDSGTLQNAGSIYTGAMTATNLLADNATITLGATKVLSVTGTGGFTLGDDTGVSSTNLLTLTGAGSLSVKNAAANVTVGLAQGGSGAYNNTATLDLTGLASVTLGDGTTAINELRVGYGQTTNGTLKLSNTANTITATTVQIGHSNGFNGTGSNLLQLGTGTNVINADTINIGLSKGNGKLQFASQTAGSPGTVTIANKAGTGGANIVIGSNNGTNTGISAVGLLDLRGHVTMVTAGTVTIGTSTNTAAGSPQGTLSFDAGTFNATTVNIATGAAASGAFNVTGTLNIGGGTFTVGTIGMANKSAAGTGTATGAINVSGGELIVNTAFTLATQATDGLSSGTLAITATGKVTSNVNILDGGGTNSASTITLNGGILDLTGHTIGNATNSINTLNFQSGTLQNVAQINNGAGLTKTTSGTLILDGINTYTGATTVSAGTLAVSGTLSGTAVTVNNTNTILSITGAGTLGSSLAVNAGAHLAIAVANTAATQPARSVSGAVTLDSASVLDLTAAGTPAAGVYTLLGAGSLTTLPTTINTPTLPAGTTWTVSHPGDNSLVLTVAVAGGYDSWATTKGLDGTNNGATQDPNKNGISNLLEYVLNGDPLNSESPALILPVLNASGSNFVFSFTRLVQSTTDTTQVFQYGTDLSGWTSLNITAPTASEVALGTPSGGLQTVTVTISKSLAGPGGKLFGRLQAVKIP